MYMLRCIAIYVPAAIAVLVGPAPVHAASEEKPNIVFLLADDQSFYTMGCYGNKDVKTPNMDRLAAEGVVFDNYYNTTAICMASRASVMTGMYEYKTGCNFSAGSLSTEYWANSYPVLLRKAGYRTAFAGKFGVPIVGRDLPDSDFDAWGGSPGQSSYETAKNASMAKYADRYPHSTLSYGAFSQDFITESAEQGKPFCLSISFKAPHKPSTPDPKFDSVYAGMKFTKPDNFGRENGEHFSVQSRQGRQYPRFFEWGYADDYDEQMRLYHQLVYAVDVALGMIRDELAEQNVADNTVIIYTSDNGYLCGSHGYGSKVLPYEESSRAPLIVYDPRHSSSGKKLRTAAVTGNIDIAPTILELAGLPIPKHVQGRSVLPLLDDPDADTRQALALTNFWGPVAAHSFGVVTRQWKYIYWFYGAEGMTPTEELYDMRNDKLELTNAAADSGGNAAIEAARAAYDQQLSLLKQSAAPDTHHRQYAILFDRQIPWSEKAATLAGPKAEKQEEKDRTRPKRNKKEKGTP